MDGKKKSLILLIIWLIPEDLVLWLSPYFRGTTVDVFSFIKFFHGPSVSGVYSVINLKRPSIQSIQ